MKMLLPPAQIVIPSNHPRTRRGPDSRGIRICVAQIGRSCLLQQGYVTFTDGSAYVYDAPSNVEFEALCASIQRGRQFNFQVRRAAFGFVKGFTPPGDYEVIYTYPPYPGTTPTACAVSFINWNDMIWDPPVVDVGTPPRTMTALTAGNSFSFFCDGRPPDPFATDFPNADIAGGFSYTGPGGVCNLRFDIDQGPSVAAFFVIDFSQDGNPIDLMLPNPAVSGDYPFDIAPGVASVLHFEGFFQGVTGQGPTNCTGVFTPAN